MGISSRTCGHDDEEALCTRMEGKLGEGGSDPKHNEKISARRVVGYQIKHIERRDQDMSID